jgi:gas vesicle protein
MGSFTNGTLVGLGISLFLAPMKGEEMRRLLAERIRYLRGIPPENPELKQSVAQMSERVQQAEEQAIQMHTAAQDFAQETTTRANVIQSDLSNAKQQTATKPSKKRPRNAY